MVKRISALILHLTGAGAAVCLLGMLVVVSIQVVTRFLPGVAAPSWTEEVSRLLFVYCIAFGIGVGIMERAFPKLELVSNWLSKKQKTKLATAINATLFVFLMFAGYCAVYFVGSGQSETSPSVGYSMSLPFFSMFSIVLDWRPVLLDGIAGNAAREQGFMIWLLFVVFLVLLLLEFPIAFALGISTFVYLIVAGLPLTTLPLKVYAGLDVFVLLSVPGFILAGNLMNASGMTDRIVSFSNALFGHVRGGLGLANIGASMLFSGISGTAVADTASIGSIMIPAMEKEGYEPEFSCAVTATSSTIGPIIPPSMPMIIAGSLTGLSIGKLFLAGAIPGLLLAIGLMAVSYFISAKRNHPRRKRATLSQMGRGLLDAFWALLMMLLVLFGIVGGVFTPDRGIRNRLRFCPVRRVFLFIEHWVGKTYTRYSNHRLEPQLLSCCSLDLHTCSVGFLFANRCLKRLRTPFWAFPITSGFCWC